ncbi:MAG: flagellar motor protein MotB, partial [Pseudomonadota bacterium]|nr:flagellar motor protein MotB [Pseudomonadota bacterium]
MARKKRHEEHENHERWLVSYADFITLLFAFFVVMYALSSVNEGKYRVLSDSLVNAFNTPQKDIVPITISESINSPPDIMMNLPSPINPNNPTRPIILQKNTEPSEPSISPTEQSNLNKIADQLSLA